LITFLNPKTNPKHAQIVYTTHDSWQLSNDLLRRDEIWFTEKNSKGVSTRYSLAEFVDKYGVTIRKDESYEKNYLLGKYGAIPTLRTFDMFEGSNMARDDRNGQRRAREANRNRVPDLGYYFVVTDTSETEENYLFGFRDSMPKELRGRLVLNVSSAKTDELVAACRELASLEPQYGQPWTVFDRDRVMRFDEII